MFLIIWSGIIANHYNAKGFFQPNFYLFKPPTTLVSVCTHKSLSYLSFVLRGRGVKQKMAETRDKTWLGVRAEEKLLR